MLIWKMWNQQTLQTFISFVLLVNIQKTFKNIFQTYFNATNFKITLQVQIYLCHWYIKIFLLRGVDLCDIIYFNLVNARRCVCMHNKT